MDATRRDVLAAAVTAAGATATQDFAHPEEHDHHDHQDVPSDVALRVKSLESLLVEKGIVDRVALDALVDAYEHNIGPRNGARVVARAWVDPAYKQRLLTNGTAAIAELGYGGSNSVDIRVLENTPSMHNIVVCTSPRPIARER
jgi:nitrile hydratase